MINYIEYLVEHLGLPGTVAVTFVVIFFFMQLVGEALELKGKVVPEVLKIRKYWARKRKEREDLRKVVEMLPSLQTVPTMLSNVEKVLSNVDAHYSADNITKRDGWMKWVNDRANVYDDSIVEISKNLTDVTEALRDNTKMTEEMFVQSSRDRIIDFATKAGNDDSVVSREEFNRIFKVYDKYETFLKERGLSNGEVDIAYRIINSSYENHLKNHTFVEDIRGYDI